MQGVSFPPIIKQERYFHGWSSSLLIEAKQNTCPMHYPSQRI